jgi:hypothetical protein
MLEGLKRKHELKPLEALVVKPVLRAWMELS